MVVSLTTNSYSAIKTRVGDDNKLFAAFTSSSPIAILINLAYRRAYYTSENKIRKTLLYLEGLNISKGLVLSRPYTPYVIGKGYALPFSKNKLIRTNPSDLIHLDV